MVRLERFPVLADTIFVLALPTGKVKAPLKHYSLTALRIIQQPHRVDLQNCQPPN
jgi:hypothetical protein